MLDARNAQALHPRAIHSPLPRRDFFQRQVIAFADLVDAQQAAIDRGDHLGLAANHPARGVGRGQHLQRERLAKRPNYAGRPDLLVFNHFGPRTAVRALLLPLLSLPIAPRGLPAALASWLTSKFVNPSGWRMARAR